MDENLYDEFGNYIGPELESEGDESESEAASESEEEQEVRRAVPCRAVRRPVDSPVRALQGADDATNGESGAAGTGDADGDPWSAAQAGEANRLTSGAEGTGAAPFLWNLAPCAHSGAPSACGAGGAPPIALGQGTLIPRAPLLLAAGRRRPGSLRAGHRAARGQEVLSRRRGSAFGAATRPPGA